MLTASPLSILGRLRPGAVGLSSAASQFWWLQVRDFGLFADFLIMEARSV